MRREQRNLTFQDQVQTLHQSDACDLLMGGEPDCYHRAVQLLMDQHLVNVSIGPLRIEVPNLFVLAVRADIGQCG